jgi:putative nucleotidyltransferase with HDIG domain
MSEAERAARAALAGTPAWVVGGAVRDRLLGRPTVDLDLVVAADPSALARVLAGACDGSAFRLSEQHAAWRVLAPDGAWHVDLMPLEAGIEEDLGRRDFTINALAEPLDGGSLLDPHGGQADLEAGRLRMVSEQGFADDPLRVLRAARLACELGLEIEPDTAAAARAHAPELARVAPERLFAELRHVVCSPAPLRGIELMDRVGATPVVLPELAALRGIEQSEYHHLDVYQHTLAVLAEVIELERDPGRAAGEHAPAVASLLAEPLADELTRGGALRFGALLHDVAKPHTRAYTPEGRVTFIGHDELGSELAAAALRRLRASGRLRAHVAGLVRNHLRLGFLVHERPLARRALHRYLRACEPVEVDVTLLSIADRLATRGRRAEQAIAAHLELAREVIGEALEWRSAGPPAPLLRGQELAEMLGIGPGPEIGRLLAALEEAQFAGDVLTREDALALARRLRKAPADG